MEKLDKLDKYEDLPVDQKNLLNDAEELMHDVLDRVKISSEKYRTAYTLADVQNEFDAEILDIVGWPLLEAVRIRQIMRDRLANMDGLYLKKFLEYNDSEYLNTLRAAIDSELSKRTTIKEDDIVS